MSANSCSSHVHRHDRGRLVLSHEQAQTRAFVRRPNALPNTGFAPAHATIPTQSPHQGRSAPNPSATLSMTSVPKPPLLSNDSQTSSRKSRTRPQRWQIACSIGAAHPLLRRLQSCQRRDLLKKRPLEQTRVSRLNLNFFCVHKPLLHLIRFSYQMKLSMSIPFSYQIKKCTQTDFRAYRQQLIVRRSPAQSFQGP